MYENPYNCNMKLKTLSWISPIILVLICISCSSPMESNKTVFYNGIFYNPETTEEAISFLEVTNGKITAMGKWDDYTDKAKVKSIDLEGKFVYPGFIDAHAHFAGFPGQSG